MRQDGRLAVSPQCDIKRKMIVKSIGAGLSILLAAGLAFAQASIVPQGVAEGQTPVVGL